MRVLVRAVVSIIIRKVGTTGIVSSNVAPVVDIGISIIVIRQGCIESRAVICPVHTRNRNIIGLVQDTVIVVGVLTGIAITYTTLIFNHIVDLIGKILQTYTW